MITLWSNAVGSLLTIQMFGGLRVRMGNHEIARFPTQKAASLLAYLAYRREPQAREVLVDLLWPDSLPEAGRASLSQALSMLRRQLEPPGVAAGAVIVATKTHVGINGDAIETDVDVFNRSLRVARLATGRAVRIEALRDAIDTYRGELLPGLYEDWVLAEQRRLSDLYFQTVESLVAHLRESGDLPLAIECVRKAVGVDPLREQTHRELMRLLASAGRPAEALEQYRELQRILDSELGAEPDLPTQELAREIERVPAMPPGSPSITPRESLSKSLPRGTVTFLSADLAVSQSREADSPAGSLEDTFGVLRANLVERDGHAVHQTGDSLLAAFESPSSALACVVDSQLSTPDFQRNMRIALHTGEVKLEAGEYQGPAIQRASRILAAAHAGQIVASETFATLVRRDLPPGTRLVDLGVFRLRDVLAPERLFQVSYEGMPQTEFPPLRAEAGYQSNLPLQYTRFFGRDAEIGQLSEMVRVGDSRLVTITGVGGTGKTRLALEVANRMLEPFAGAVWFVPLVDLSDPELIAGAIVDAMRIPRSANRDPLDQAVEALNRQPSLLILDNLEQFLGVESRESGVERTWQVDAARLVRDLLERAATLTCLVTSRRSLSLMAEREFALAPLMTPNGKHPPERLTMYESVRLFVDRAQAVKPDFQVTNQNAPAVAELCDRLEGIPLAIELAAARAGALAPSQMLVQLENRFEFLVGRKRDAQSRHYTLRAAIDWSYRLLPPDVQRFFARLSVFRGGWTLEAAEAVCEEPRALKYLEHLQECSLIRSNETDFGMRFGMLETLREFGWDELADELRTPTQERRTAWLAAFAEDAVKHMEGPREAECQTRLAAEHDNVRAAMEWGGGDHAREARIRICASLWRHWDVRGHLAEGRRWLESVIAAEGRTNEAEAGARSIEFAVIVNATGTFCLYQAQYSSAHSYCAAAHAIYLERGHHKGMASTMGNMGVAAFLQRDYSRALTLLESQLAIERELGDRNKVSAALQNLGTIAYQLGDLDLAEAKLAEGLEYGRSVGNRRGVAGMLNDLGMIAVDRRDHRTARNRLVESLAIAQELSDRWTLAYTFEALGRLVPYLLIFLPCCSAHSRSFLLCDLLPVQ